MFTLAKYSINEQNKEKHSLNHDINSKISFINLGFNNIFFYIF